jgi:hypothetical protein
VRRVRYTGFSDPTLRRGAIAPTNLLIVLHMPALADARAEAGMSRYGPSSGIAATWSSTAPAGTLVRSDNRRSSTTSQRATCGRLRRWQSERRSSGSWPAATLSLSTPDACWPSSSAARTQAPINPTPPSPKLSQVAQPDSEATRGIGDAQGSIGLAARSSFVRGQACVPASARNCACPGVARRARRKVASRCYPRGARR